MQITVNTKDILGDETTIRDEVIEQVVAALTLSMRQDAVERLDKLLNEQLSKVVAEQVAATVNMHLDTEFADMDAYGRPGKTCTVRARIADFIQQQCTFKRENYSNNENAFTKAVREVVEKEVAKFKAEFNALVTRQVVEQSAEMATQRLRDALGIKGK